MSDHIIEIADGDGVFVPCMTDYEIAMLAIARERLSLARDRDHSLRESLSRVSGKIKKIDAEATQLFIKLNDRLSAAETGIRRLCDKYNGSHVELGEIDTQLSDIRECMKGACERFKSVDNKLAMLGDRIECIECAAWREM